MMSLVGPSAVHSIQMIYHAVTGLLRAAGPTSASLFDWMHGQFLFVYSTFQVHSDLQLRNVCTCSAFQHRNDCRWMPSSLGCNKIILSQAI